MIRARIKANRYILQNREGTIQVMMQWMKVDRDTAIATYDGSVKSFNDDGAVSEAGLRIALGRIAQGREHNPRSGLQRNRRFFHASRGAAGAGD